MTDGTDIDVDTDKGPTLGFHGLVSMIGTESNNALTSYRLINVKVLFKMGQAFLQGVFITRLLEGVTDRNINHIDLLKIIYFRRFGTSVKDIQLNCHIPK